MSTEIENKESYILYVDNNPITDLCTEQVRRSLLMTARATEGFEILADFLSQHVIVASHFDDLKRTLDVIIDKNESNPHVWFAETLKEVVSDYVGYHYEFECLYIKKKELPLLPLIAKLATDWQERYMADSLRLNSAAAIVAKYFGDDYTNSEEYLEDSDDGPTVAEAVYNLFVEIRRRDWERVEMALNAVDGVDREHMDFVGVLDFVSNAD